MPPDALTRDAIVGALDDLGERPKLPAGRRSASDERPYPPSAVEERLCRLQWRWGVQQLGLSLVGVALFVAGWMLRSGQPLPAVLKGLVLGGGAGLAVGSATLWWKRAPEVQAMQLYGFLKQLDEAHENAE